MIFDKPVYENLGYEYIDFVYYYLLQKSYNAIVADLHERCYVATMDAHQNNTSCPDPFPQMTNDFYTFYFNYAAVETSSHQWEKIFSLIEIELHYFYDIHKEYYHEFEEDDYPGHPAHPSHPSHIQLMMYPVGEPSSPTPPATHTHPQFLSTYRPSSIPPQVYQPPESREKTFYLNKIKNRIILDVRKLFALDFDPSPEQALALPSHILSIFKHLPPNSVHFYNYVRNKHTRNYFIEAMAISNIMAWL